MMETPQNTPHHYLNVGEHTLKSLEYVDADKVLRFTMLLHDTGKPASKTADENGRDHFLSLIHIWISAPPILRWS